MLEISVCPVCYLKYWYWKKKQLTIQICFVLQTLLLLWISVFYHSKKNKCYCIFWTCRIDINSSQSLFGNNTTFNNSYFESQKYCDCVEEHSGTNTSVLFSDFNVANCSITTENILCSEKTTFQSFTSTCRRYQHRYKRDVNEMDFEHQIEKRSVDSDDIIEVAPLTLDPNFDPNFIPPVHI